MSQTRQKCRKPSKRHQKYRKLVTNVKNKKKVKNFKQPGENRQKYRKTAKISQNPSKISKYRVNTIKNIEKLSKM